MIDILNGKVMTATRIYSLTVCKKHAKFIKENIVPFYSEMFLPLVIEKDESMVLLVTGNNFSKIKDILENEERFGYQGYIEYEEINQIFTNLGDI